MSDTFYAWVSCVACLATGAAISFFVVIKHQGPHEKFAADCTQSTIQMQYAEQQGQRVMVVQCERAK